MRTFSTAASFVVLLAAGAGAAQAQGAPAVTDASARDVQAVLERYVGKPATGAGAVRVSPNVAGDGYDVAIDLARLAKPLELAGITVGPASLGFGLKPQADGTWRYGQTSFPTLSVTAPGARFDYALTGLNASGVFDPRLSAFTSFSLAAASATTTTEDASSKITAGTNDLKISGGATDAGGGGVDATVTYTTGNFAETITASRGANSSSFRISFADSALKGAVSGKSAAAVLDLWAYLVAHPSRETLAADVAGLKQRLLAALPLFRTLTLEAAANNLIVESPLGTGRLARVGLSESANGIVPDGRFAFGLTFGALEPPSAVLPSWARALLPQDSALGVQLSGYDLDAATRASVASLDLRPDADEPVTLSSDQFVAALLPKGTLAVEATPGHLKNDLYDVTWSGSAVVAPATGTITGKATVRAVGLDKVGALLARSSETVQYAGALFMAKALARPDGDADIWDIEYRADGSILVNGKPLGG